jgi:pyrimidine nucleoside transport protein
LEDFKKDNPRFEKVFNVIVPLLFLAAVIVFLVIDTADERERLVSALGVVAFVLIAFIFSAHPGHIRWRHVFWGLGLEFVFGLLVLRWEVIKKSMDF